MKTKLERVHPQIEETQMGVVAYRLRMDRPATLVPPEAVPTIVWVVAAVDLFPPTRATVGCLWGVGSDRNGAFQGEWALWPTKERALEHARELLVQWDAAWRLGATEGFPPWWTRPGGQ